MHQPILIDMVAASIAHSIVERYNKENLTRRIYPTRQELSRAYAMSISQAQKRGLVYAGTNKLTPAGENAEIAAVDRFRPEMQEWLEKSLAKLRNKTMKKKSMRKNPSNDEAKRALREVGSGLWTGAKWTGERLGAGLKAGAKATYKGVRYGSKVAAKYTGKGLEWGADRLEAYAARPNPETPRCKKCKHFVSPWLPTCSNCGYPTATRKPLMNLCASCNRISPRDSSNCLHCMKPFPRKNPSSTGVSYPKKARKNPPMCKCCRLFVRKGSSCKHCGCFNG